jgi:hypothetical protein
MKNFKFLETNENGNTTYPNLWYIAKAKRCKQWMTSLKKVERFKIS